MTNIYKKYPWIIRSIILTPIIAIFALLTAGGGHGTPIFVILLYPYTTLIAFFIKVYEIGEVIFHLGVLLYIIYGIILTIAERVDKFKQTLGIIILAHAVAVISCIIMYVIRN